MMFRFVISKATRLKMWSCNLKVWFEKWRWGRIFVEVWTSCKLHFRVPLQVHQRWGGSHGKLSYNPHIRCCGGPCPDYPSVVLQKIQKQVVGAFIWSLVLEIRIWRRHYSLPIVAFAQKQDTHLFRSNTLKRDFRLNSFKVREVVAGSFGILAAWTTMHWPARVHVENKVKNLCKEWLGISDNQWQVTWERRQVAFWNFHLRRRFAGPPTSPRLPRKTRMTFGTVIWQCWAE